jgi:murein DD-endopeptidase MepM/ murein hydrolase activator NlpD
VVTLGRIARPLVSVALLRPIRMIGRFLFMHVLVNIYRFYFAIKAKGGGYQQSGRTATLPTFINNRQTIHAGIFVMAAMTIFVNITETNAESYVEGTLLNKLVTQEFPEEELIIEGADSVATEVTIKKQVKYTGNGYISVQPKSQGEISEADFLDTQNISLARDGSAILTQEVATTKIDQNTRTDAELYIVESGDTVTSIAKKFDISISTILWENNLSAYSIIRPGKELVILPATGINHTVAKGDTIASLAKKYQVEPDAILESNRILNEDDIRVNQLVFIPEGLKPQPAPSPQVDRAQTPKQSFSAAPTGGDFIWPTNSYTITQYFTWRHFGIDIGNKSGQPVYASAEGVVELSSQGKWNGGYGNQVVINHGNGFKTRYAHNSYNLVSAGETVTQGQAIAAVGSTGRSSGPHSHFEIMYNGRRVNPFNYVSR